MLWLEAYDIIEDKRPPSWLLLKLVLKFALLCAKLSYPWSEKLLVRIKGVIKCLSAPNVKRVLRKQKICLMNDAIYDVMILSSAESKE